MAEQAEVTEYIEGVDYVVHKPASRKHEMILSNDAQILVIGGAMGGGKTYLQQMLGLRYIDDPNTAIVTFRRTMDEIKGQGGVFETAQDIYGSIHPDLRPEVTESKLKFKFPSGATSVYKGMELVKDARKNQGLQFTLCNFDEGTLFEWPQIEYLFQRMRSKSKYQSRIVISTNPDPDHKLCELIEWYLDEDGFPIPEREGVIRYFVRRDGEFYFANTREELGETFNIPMDKIHERVLSFSFIGCTIYDNPPNLESNPEYLAFLEGMNAVDKARNLHGNWYARPEGSKIWKREWVRGDNGERVKNYKDIPSELTWYRGWDKGYSVPSDVNKYPDYTAGSSKFGKDKSGMYWMVGDYVPENYDLNELEKAPKDRILGRVRQLAGERDSSIIRQALSDGDSCKVVLTKDSGGAGTDHTFTKSRLIGKGIKVVEDKSPKNTLGKKLQDFQPFANACSLGLVYIVEASYSPPTLKAIYAELESFDPDKKSTSSRKDDWVDSHSLAFNASSVKKAFRLTPRNQKRASTEAVSVLNHSAGIQEQYAQHAQPDLTDLN